MMNYDIFLEVVKEKFLDFLPKQYQNGKVVISKVDKVNRTLDGLSVLFQDSSKISPNLYVNQMYEHYLETEDFEMVLQEAANSYAKHLEIAKEAAPDINLQNMKDNVVFTLINTEQNKDLLENIPHRPFQDLSVMFRWVVSQDERGISSAIVNNSMMEQAGLTPETLMKHAIENTKKLCPVSVCSMEEVLLKTEFQEMGREFLDTLFGKERDPKETMWIISNERGINGAASILYEENLRKLAEKVGTDLYLLPSSIHECIAVSVEMGTPEELSKMVQEVNMQQVSLEERLSNNVYHYDKELRKVTMATDTPNKRLDGIVAETDNH